MPVSSDDGVLRGSLIRSACVSSDGQTLERSVLDGLSVRHLVLVVDNCEHVLARVATLVDRLLAAAPHVRVLATSRETLGVPGEQVFPLSPLPTEGGLAAQLFIERARAVRPQLDFSTDDFAAVDAICARLDGLPLAIEVAASRVRSLAPRELAARLDDRLRLLRSTGRATGTHHDTLDATIQWSYDLLDEGRRRLFERLAIFPGSFDVAAVATVADSLVADETDAFDEVDRLAGKSLVVPDRGRFHLLVTVHAFAAARLGERGDADADAVENGTPDITASWPADSVLVCSVNREPTPSTSSTMSTRT